MKKNLRYYLKDKLKNDELELVPSSFDVVGSIAIFNEFPPISIRKEKAVAEARKKIRALALAHPWKVIGLSLVFFALRQPRMMSFIMTL